MKKKKAIINKLFDHPEEIRSKVTWHGDTLYPRYEIAKDGSEYRTFRPVKILCLDGTGLVALCRAFTNEDSWFIFSSEDGTVSRSKIYSDKHFAEVAWSRLCDELTFQTKENLIAKLEDDKLPREERDKIRDRCYQLELADDGEYDGGVIPNTSEFRAFCVGIESELAARKNERQQNLQRL